MYIDFLFHRQGFYQVSISNLNTSSYNLPNFQLNLIFMKRTGGIYGDINPNGIMFYNKIIDNLLLKGEVIMNDIVHLVLYTP